MATAHLISGLPCSGKTTYAKALAADINGVHFALDYWLITAFGKYSIDAKRMPGSAQSQDSIGHEEHVRRVLACRELIWRSAASLLIRGVDVILDDGFFFRDNRKQQIRLANELGAEAVIHYLATPVDVLRARIEKRNARLPTYNFRIDPAMMDVFIGLFEVPASDEGARLVVVDGPPAPIEREAIRGILLTPANEVLLLRIRLPEGPEAFWIAPGGGLEPGEAIEDALKRELREELGLDEFVIGPLVWRRQHTFNWEGKRICQRERYHIVHVDRFEPRMLDRNEAKVLDRFHWWPVAELANSHERLTPLSLAKIVERYLSYGPPREPLELEVLAD